MSAKYTISKVVKLDPETKERLERLGEAKHRSPHWLMKEAIARYLLQEEHTEQVNQETVARWKEASQGKIVDHQTVSNWLDTWGTDKESDKPRCKK